MREVKNIFTNMFAGTDELVEYVLKYSDDLMYEIQSAMKPFMDMIEESSKILAKESLRLGFYTSKSFQSF